MVVSGDAFAGISKVVDRIDGAFGRCGDALVKNDGA